jgi:hypothetical protein
VRRDPEGRVEVDGRGPALPGDPESRGEAESRAEAGDRAAGQLRDPESQSEVESWTEAEERAPEQPRGAESRSAAEERSRWNHPSNWHRRKAARAEIRDRVAEPDESCRLTDPEEPNWPRRDPDQAVEPSRWSRLDEQTSWTQLDDAVNRSRRYELDRVRERRNDDPENPGR